MAEDTSISKGMQDAISPKDSSEEEPKGTFLPRILDMHVIHGLGEGKKPDPNKILFYHDTASDKYYDCDSHEWCDEKPSVVDHLYNRPIAYNDQDIVAAIAHGVMDDGDYEALDKSGLLGEMPKKLWSHIKTLKDLVDQQEKMAKSDEESMESEDPESNDLDSEPTSEIHEEELSGEIPQSQEDDMEMPGDNVIEMIMAAALSKADDRLREIVREEIARLLSGDGDSSDEEFDNDQEEQLEDTEETEQSPESDELD